MALFWVKIILESEGVGRVSESEASSHKLYRFFGDHPASVGETYFEHLAQASGFGLRLIASGLACLVHAMLPAAFSNAASDTVESLYQSMVVERQQRNRRP